MAHVLSCRLETEYDAQEPTYKLRQLRCREAETRLEAIHIVRDLVADFVMGTIGMGYVGASAKLRAKIDAVVSMTHDDDDGVCFGSDGKVDSRFFLQWHEDEEQYECYDSDEEVSLYVKIQ